MEKEKKKKQSSLKEEQVQSKKRKDSQLNEESEAIENKVLKKKKVKTEDLDTQNQEKSNTKSLEKSKIQKEETIQNESVSEEEYPNKLSDYIKDPKTIEVLQKKGIKYLFPIQESTYNIVYEGKDLIGKDRTGSGKTLSFALPLIEKLRKEGLFKRTLRGQRPYVLVIVPTRELCIQVSNEFNTLLHQSDEFRLISLYGGTEIRAQQQMLRDGIEIAVGCPGRIIDLYDRGCLSFKELKAVVLDEADQMLNFNFQEDIEKIFDFITKENPKKTQNLLFSATIPDWVLKLSEKYLNKDRAFIDLVKSNTVKTSTTVQHLAINCPFQQRIEAIGDVILYYGGGAHSRVIVFCETKNEANDILLKSSIKQDMQVLHGDIPQKQREITFKGFREGKFKCLVATNVASRGLDIPEVDLIVQLEPPKDFETYIHRAGRTARAGRSGACITFYTKKHQIRLENIERRANIKFKKVGAPQPQDIIKATQKDILISLKSVSHDAALLFKESAQELIEDLGAEEAICRAIAFISGYTDKMKQRSLLCAIDGFITLICKCSFEIRSNGYVWAFLRQHFPENVVEKIKGMKRFKDSKGAAFDIPEEHKDLFEKYIEDYQKGKIYKGLELQVATTLPELVEDVPYNNGFGGSSGGYGNQGNSGYGQRNGYGSERAQNGYHQNGTSNQQKQPFSTLVRASKDEIQKALKRKEELEIFVGGLSYDASDDDVIGFFDGEGIKVLQFRLLKDQSGNSKGLGFGLCADDKDIQKALNCNGKRFMGRTLNINMANNKKK